MQNKTIGNFYKIKAMTNRVTSPQQNEDAVKLKVKESSNDYLFPAFRSTSLESSPKADFIRFNHHYNNLHTLDAEKVKDELLKLKLENNKTKKEVNQLRIDNLKLEEDNKKNIMMIEEILYEAGRSPNEIIKNIMGNSSSDRTQQQEVFDSQPPKEFNISPNNFIRLREAFVISSLKKQINAMKQILQLKEDEIERYKNSSKTHKFSKLNYNYTNNLSELNNVKKEYEILRNKFEEMNKKQLQTVEEREYCRNTMNKYKSQYDESKIKMRALEEDKVSLLETKKQNEDKISYLIKCNHQNKLNTTTNNITSGNGHNNMNLSYKIQDKETEIHNMRNELEQIEKIKMKYEKRISELNKEKDRLKEELE